MVGRRGKKRALIAVAHKILIAAYHILEKKEEYKELGGKYLAKLKKDKKIQRHLHQLRELGVDISVEVA